MGHLWSCTATRASLFDGCAHPMQARQSVSHCPGAPMPLVCSSAFQLCALQRCSAARTAAARSLPRHAQALDAAEAGQRPLPAPASLLQPVLGAFQDYSVDNRCAEASQPARLPATHPVVGRVRQAAVLHAKPLALAAPAAQPQARQPEARGRQLLSHAAWQPEAAPAAQGRCGQLGAAGCHGRLCGPAAPGPGPQQATRDCPRVCVARQQRREGRCSCRSSSVAAAGGNCGLLRWTTSKGPLRLQRKPPPMSGFRGCLGRRLLHARLSGLHEWSLSSAGPARQQAGSRRSHPGLRRGGGCAVQTGGGAHCTCARGVLLLLLRKLPGRRCKLLQVSCICSAAL